MKKINLNTNSYGRLNLGRQGENEITEICFDFSEWAEEYGAGTVSLMVRRPSENGAYLANITTADNMAAWLVSSTDTAIFGDGAIEYKYTVNGKIVKSQIFETFVIEALDNTSEPPVPWVPYIEAVAENAAKAETAADQAETARDGAEDARDAVEAMTATAEIDENSGTPAVTVTKSTEGGVVSFHFSFHNLRGADGAVAFAVVDELPTTDIHLNWIYLVLDASAETGNRYKEFVYINGQWEQIGTASIDLSNYVQKVTSATLGNVATLTADGSITDGGIALSELATLSALSQALSTKVDIITYDTDMGRLFPPVKQKGDTTISATNDSYIGNYRIDADGGLIEASNYKAYKYEFTEKGTVHFNSFGNNSYVMVGIYSGNPSAATFIPPRKSGSTPADIGTISVESGNIIVFTGIPQSSAVEFSFIFTHEIDKPSSVPIISSIQKVYVATNGSDTNDGTKEHPFATVEKAISVSQNVVLKSGVYSESVSIKDKYNISICADTERADPDKVVFDYTGNTSAIFECENVIGLHIADIEIKNASGNGCNIHKCSNVNIDSCRFYYNGAEGLSLDNSNANVTNCTADYNGNDGFNIHGHGNTNFNDCVAHHNGRVNPDVGDGLSHHDDCTGYIVGGYFYDNAKGGISSPTYGAIVNISNAFVYGNRFGMQIYGGDSMTENSTTVKIDNCVFKSNTVGIQVNKYAVDLVNCVFTDNTTDRLVESGTVRTYTTEGDDFVKMEEVTLSVAETSHTINFTSAKKEVLIAIVVLENFAPNYLKAYVNGTSTNETRFFIGNPNTTLKKHIWSDFEIRGGRLFVDGYSSTSSPNNVTTQTQKSIQCLGYNVVSNINSVTITCPSGEFDIGTKFTVYAR